jgi:uncharacterized protein YndB with AHSA1/START domain
MVSDPRQLNVHLERVMPAPRPVAFQMFAEPEQLARWWGPNGFTALSIEMELRAGGRYRIEMQPPEGHSFLLVGEFREVVPLARLVYTFRWVPPDPDDRETTVELTLRDLGDATVVVLDHGAFATEARRALHEQGWTETLDRLHGLLAT